MSKPKRKPSTLSARTRKNRVHKRVKRSPVAMKGQDPPWRPDEVVALRKAIGDGLSYGQIVRHRLPRKTRNAVIGKCHRLGIREKMTSTEHRMRSAQHNNASNFSDRVSRLKRHALKHEGKTAQLYAFGTKGNGVSDTTMKAIMALREGEHCKWPIGDPKSNSFKFCGCAPIEGEPYCADHHKAAYEPAISVKTLASRMRGVARFADFVDGRTFKQAA